MNKNASVPTTSKIFSIPASKKMNYLNLKASNYSSSLPPHKITEKSETSAVKSNLNLNLDVNISAHITKTTDQSMNILDNNKDQSS